MAEEAVLCLKPAGLSFAAAASLPVSGAAALLACQSAGLVPSEQRKSKKSETKEESPERTKEATKKQEGKEKEEEEENEKKMDKDTLTPSKKPCSVLVRGASGGVGSLLIQLSRAQVYHSLLCRVVLHAQASPQALY